MIFSVLSFITFSYLCGSVFRLCSITVTSLLACVRVRARSVASVGSDSVTPWTVAGQVLLSLGFSRQEYWSGLPDPPPGHLLTQ